MKQYLTLLCTMHTDIFILFILFFSLISWSIALNPFHDILMDHHSQFKKNTTTYKTCKCHIWDEILEKLWRPLQTSPSKSSASQPDHALTLQLFTCQKKEEEKAKSLPKWVTQWVTPTQVFISQNLALGMVGKKRSNPFDWIKCAIREFLAI